MNRLGHILLLTVVFTGLVGAETVELDLDKCLTLALENNLDYKASAISLETAEREKSHSWNEYLPSISASAGLTDSESLLDWDDASWTAWGDMDVSLSLSPDSSRAVEGLDLAYESALISSGTDRLELINEVEKDYYSLIASLADIEIEAANLELAEKRYNYTKNKFDKGLESELSVLQAKVNAANLKPAYLQAVSDYETSLREFLTLIGLDPDSDVELIGSLDVPTEEFDAQALIDSYLSNRRDILAAEINLDILENNRAESAASNRSPSVTLSAGWTPSYSDALSGGLGDPDSFFDSLSLRAYISIPLDDWIPGSTTSDILDNYDDQIRSAELSLEQTREDARTEIANLVAELETAAANLELSELNVELNRMTYEKSEESYNQGGMEQLDLEDAQQDYFSAEQDYLESKYSYLEGLINLRYALGLESLEGLE